MHPSTDSLYLQLAALLRGRIEQGVYPAGKALPVESAMCDEHGVGRMTVRRALAVLREEGLITTTRGVPSIVRFRTTRKSLVLQRDERVVSRMPSRVERVQLGLDPGIPLLEVRRTDGAGSQFRFGPWSADRWDREVAPSPPLAAHRGAVAQRRSPPGHRMLTIVIWR